MMTDAMKPLGLSLWQLTTPRPMAEAGGRLFVDVTQILASPASRAGLLEMAGKSDPLIGDALQTVLERAASSGRSRTSDPAAGCPPGSRAADHHRDRSGHRRRVDRAQRGFDRRLQRDIRTKSGSALLDFILEDIQELKRILFDPQSAR